MYIDEQGHEYDGIFLISADNPVYRAGWYFSDECSNLNGPYSELCEARREMRLYNQRLSQVKFDYDTFSDSRVYKTLPYIMDRVNEMDKYKQAKVSRYFNTLNKACNNLSELKSSKTKLYQIQRIVTEKSNVCYLPNVSYYQSLMIKDFISKIDHQFSKYDPKFISYLKNFTKAKINKLIQEM